MKISIIIPVYEEEKTIAKVLDRIKKVKGINKEIIIVDDFSKDNTVKILNHYKGIKFKLIEHSKNYGKGMAVRTGIKEATGDIILIQDADLEYNPQDYKKLIKPILENKALVVYGNRFNENNFNMHPLHYFGNRGLTFITNLLYGSSINDMEVGYKVMRREVLECIKLNARRFDLEPEITAKILKLGCNIYQVPISFNPRDFDEGKKINWVDGIKALYYLIKYRFMD